MNRRDSALVLVGRRAAGLTLHDGALADVAPTLLAFAGLPGWPGMTGRSLVDATTPATTVDRGAGPA